MNLTNVKDIVPPHPVGGGRSRQRIMASGGGGPSCSCGTWYCCSKGIWEMQEFAERFYWSNPVLSAPPIPPVPLLQRTLTSGSDEEENSRETNDTGTVEMVVEQKEGSDHGHHDKSEEEGKSSSLDFPVDKIVIVDEGGKVVEERNVGGGDFNKEADQQSNASMEYYDCTFNNDLLPPDLENMTDVIQGNSRTEPRPPVLDVEMNEGSGDGQVELAAIQPEDEPFDLFDLDQVSSHPPSLLFEAPTGPEPPPILTPAFIVQSTPPPKLTVQKLINFVRNSPLFDQPNIKTTTQSTQQLPPAPLSSLPILEISSLSSPSPPHLQLTPAQVQVPPKLTVQNSTTLVENSSSSGKPVTLEVNPPSTPPSGRHSSRKKSSTLLQCPVTSCDKTFYQSGALATHLKEHNLGENRPLFCKICERGYASQVSFDMHLWRHQNCKGCKAQLKDAPVSRSSSSPSGPMDNYCETCATNLENKSPPPSSSKRSKDNGHQDKDNNSFHKLWCQVCSKGFVYKKRFDAHMLTHKVETKLDFKCSHCENSYESKDDLTAHLESLEENKKFQCSICDKWFRLKNHLDHHMSVHKSGKGNSDEHTCVICKKSFRSRRGLSAHQRPKSLCFYRMQRMENIHKTKSGHQT